MVEILKKRSKITTGFWADKLRLNAEVAIFHQWEMLEATRCIDNFRIAARLKEGFREGFFFADSDAYKWLDAASRILATTPSIKLLSLVDEFISILEKAQDEDGYLYTYNQIHFGKSRWQNLQIEHEFYCLGHLIEAGISHIQATGEDRLFIIAKKAADLLMEEFWDAAPIFTDGHEEIEIALLKLSRHTGTSRYRELAKRFLERRGRIHAYLAHFVIQTLRSAGRMNTATAMRKHYYKIHPPVNEFHLPAHNKHLIPRTMPLRFAAQALSGRYTQQHKPLKEQSEPVGHAVRFAYLNTAATMLARDENDQSDLNRLKDLWQHMITRRMSVSGGIGSLPLTEGFGRDYEMDPEVVYNETCAALGCMLWDHEMGLLTEDPKYDNLFEWQLYNAASVGIGVDGCSYFYNNPLTTRGKYKRETWYDIPCCPSNLSRVWASLADHVASARGNEIFLHHYLGCEVEFDAGQKITLSVESRFPGESRVSVRLEMEKPAQIKLNLRKPAWAERHQLLINGAPFEPGIISSDPQGGAACGLDFDASSWLQIDRTFSSDDEIELDFDMPVRILRQDKRITKCSGKVAVALGPLLYCLEGFQNPADFKHLVLVPGTLKMAKGEGLFKGLPVIEGTSTTGEKLNFTPYFLWGNRGDSAMTVLTNERV